MLENRLQDAHSPAPFAADTPAPSRHELMAHRRARSVSLGPAMRLQFEDAWTVHHQVREILRAERISDAAGIAHETAAYAHLLPDGRQWKATLLIELPDASRRASELPRLNEAAHRLYVGCKGESWCHAQANEDLPDRHLGRPSAVHFLRFELPPSLREQLLGGTPAFVGCAHDDYRWQRLIPQQMLRLLLADLEPAVAQSIALQRRARASRRALHASALAAALAGGSALAQPQPAPAVEAAEPVAETVVTATRNEADAHKVPATITRVTRESLDRRAPADETELFENEPDVAFARDARRFGATRPNIRGIEDNRVLQLVDGIRLPNYFNGGGPTNFTLNAPLGTSTEFLKRVEVLRGPASSLYGSDAIGGVVGYLTLDPADLLAAGASLGGQLAAGYTGANHGRTGTVLGAGRGEQAEWLLGYTQTEAHGFENQGNVDTVSASRTTPNPQDVRDRSAIAKFVLRPAAGHRVVLTTEARDQDADVQVLRLASSLPKVTAMSGADSARRARASLEWEHKPGAGSWYDRLDARFFMQDAKTYNFNEQTRTNTSAGCSASTGTGNNCLIGQDFLFRQRSTGGSLQFDSTPGERQLLTWGVDAMRVRTEEQRGATVRNLTTGTTTSTLAGDGFPLRDFAPGHTDTVGLFMQDEIDGLAGGALSLTPGLRYDWRALRPDTGDALSQAVLGAIGKQAVSQTDSALSPKIAANWQFTPALAGYGQLVRGFRAPSYEEVNGHFRNPAQSYGTSPNPALEPETSTSVELGLRFNTETLRGQVAAFDNRYRNFIATARLDCPADPNCIAALGSTFMSVNLSKVRIHGAEARVAWDFLPRWRLDGAVAMARGSDQQTGQPLDTVEPARLSLGLAHEAGPWGAEARLRAAERVKRVNDNSGTTPSPWFRPAGYGVVDLGAWWRPWKGSRVSLSVNNLFDKKYWLWGDIRQADARNPAGVDFYSQPGRNVAARLEQTF